MASKFNSIFIFCLAILASCERNKQPTIDAFSLIQVEKFDREIGKVDNGN